MEFLKKNYEKVVLGVVLAGLTLAVCALPLIIKAKRDALEAARNSRKANPKLLTALVMTNEETALQRAQSPYKLDFTTKHNLVNPVVWKRVNGNLIKVETGQEEGPAALTVTAVKPLYLEVKYNAASGSGYMIDIEQENTTPDKRHKQKYVSKENPKGDLLTLQDVKGPADNPTEIDLLWNETSDSFSIAPNKSFKKIDGYAADLAYKLEGKTWMNQHTGAILNFANGRYSIVAITESNVVVSAEPNKKKTTIPFHPAN